LTRKDAPVALKRWGTALAVAAAYLAVSFFLNGWAWTWVIWVGYALCRLLEKKKETEND